MAVGRGEFFLNFMRCLERMPAQTAPTTRLHDFVRGKLVSRGRLAAPGGGRHAGRGTEMKPGRSADSGTQHSLYPSSTEPTTDFPWMNSKENFMERLPSEILIKILSYLDASSLLCISHVSKLFHHLANDDVIWQKIYQSEFGVWKPTLVGDVEVKDNRPDAEGPAAGRWKMMYFRIMAGCEVKTWRKQLRNISPHTGLPRQTELVLRNLNVSWELTLCSKLGERMTWEKSQGFFFESSVIFRWSGVNSLKYHHISSIHLYAVRKKTWKSFEARSCWRSLMLKLDTKTHPHHFIGYDGLIKLLLLPPDIVIGIWRGQNCVAFVMVSLHFHKLVEKSLLGSPACPYFEPADPLPPDNSDPALGLHGYSLHFVLHNTATEIMSAHFHRLSCSTVHIQRGLVELRVINRSNLSQHRPLSGSIKLPWKSQELEGAIENCCIMSLTLLDEFQKPFWCVSSPVYITARRNVPSWDYNGDHFLMNYRNPDGEVKMMLVWLKEQKQFFLVSLTVYVAVAKVNKRFSREYGSRTGPLGGPAASRGPGSLQVQ